MTGGCLVKRGKRWHMKYRIAGKQVMRTCGEAGRRDAERMLREVLREVDELGVAYEPPRDSPLSVLAAEFLASATSHMREVTKRSHDQRLRRHILPFFGDHSARRTLTVTNVSRFAASLVGRGYAAGTVRNILMTLSAVCEYAQATNRLGMNPVRSVRLPPHDVRSRYVLSPSQVEALIGWTPSGQERALMTFLAFTGCRPAEARFARIEDIDWAGNQFLVHRSGYGRVENGTKNRTVRHVPMNAPLRAALEEHVRRRASVTGLLFVNSRGGHVDMRRFGDRVLRPSLRRAGLAVPSGDDSLYLLRRSLATSLVQQVDAKTVSQMLGNGVATLMRHYVAPDDERLRRALSQLHGLEASSAQAV